MAGVALILDLLKKNPSFINPTLHSHGLFFSAKAAASSAAASAAFAAPFAAWAFLGESVPRIAHCDAGAALTEDYLSSVESAIESVFQKNSLYDSTKEYRIEQKPILSAFHWKNFAMMSLRSFLLFYLPLLEPHARMEEDDDDDFLTESPETQRMDLVVPFKKSVKQIVRESTVVTTRRILERFAVQHVSQRMAWKLLKDAPKSATRKALRGMPTTTYIYCVGKTTFRAHCLGVLASWLVQVGLDVYRFFSHLFNSKEEIDEVSREEQLQLLGRKIFVASVRCCSSLIFASVGAGIGAAAFRPSTGQWIGCAMGDLAGPMIVAACFEKTFHMDL